VRQTVANPEAQEHPSFAKPHTFWVAAPRYRLSPSDVYAVYPPADARGHFAASLPHVVLSRRTLPWERQLRRMPAAPNGRALPWMALLLLDEDDLRLGDPVLRCDVQNHTLQEARQVPETMIVPLWTKEPWEKEDEPCQTLDLPLELFRKLVPTREDLPYLAHVRRVGTQHMASDGIEDEGWFAVVIGNRLPSRNKENQVFLVSLEGLEAFIPSLHSTPPTPAAQRIRLVVLANWRFADDAKQGGFLELAEQARHHAGPLRLPSPGTTLRPEVEAALKMGYAPLHHTTQHGYHSMSWYRGPLVPLFLPADPQNHVYPCADAARRYDPSTGLFDVSYAAAWQLGRLLALQNTHFAQAVYTFKLRRAQRAVEDMARKAVQDRFGFDAPRPLAQTHAIEQLVVQFFHHHQPTEQGKALQQADSLPTQGAAPASDHPQDYHAELDEALKRPDTTASIPQDIAQWLGRLFLLHGVPFHYLVPHELMLPPESLRFFYLDTAWIGALLDGALSIGRSSEARLLLDKTMASPILQPVLDDLQVERTSTQALGIDWQGAEPVTVVGHLTGFLLRSGLVSGWRGLEVKGYGDDAEQPLAALRRERLAADILLCIFNGHIKRVVITQPPHSLHFGVLRGETGLRKEMLGKSMSVRTRQADGVPGVLQVSQLAADMGLPDKPATFARHMILAPVQYTVPIAIQATKPRAS
jgi:hypothetical protein